MFAEYTGNLGIGLNPEDTYDYYFRQIILSSDNNDVKRAFILSNLPSHISQILFSLEDNRKMIGKNEFREHAVEERNALIRNYHESMDLLRKLDNNRNESFLTLYESRFSKIVPVK